MPRYLVRGFYLTSDPLVERVRDFVVNAGDEVEAMNRTRMVDTDDVAYFEVDEVKP